LRGQAHIHARCEKPNDRGYTPAGQLVWESTWDGPGNLDEHFDSAQTEPDGSQVLLAQTATGSGVFQTAIVRWDAHGNSLAADLVDLSTLGSGIALPE